MKTRVRLAKCLNSFFKNAWKTDLSRTSAQTSMTFWTSKTLIVTSLMMLRKSKMNNLQLNRWPSSPTVRAHLHQMIKETFLATIKTKCYFTVCSGQTTRSISTSQTVLRVSLRLNKRSRLVKKLLNTSSVNLRKNFLSTNLTIFPKKTRSPSRPFCVRWQMAIGTLFKISTTNTTSVSRQVMSFTAVRSWSWCTSTS